MIIRPLKPANLEYGFCCTLSTLIILCSASCKPTLDTTAASSASSSTVSTSSASLTLTSIGTQGGTSVTLTAPSGVAYSSVTADQGSGFLATNIRSSTTIFGLAGTASCADTASSKVVSLTSLMPSNALRNTGSTQITQIDEASTYAGTGTSPTLPSNYRQVANVNLDDDGFCNADAVARGNCTLAALAFTATQVTAITWSQHINMTNCGTGSTIAAKIADCAAQNAATGVATWNGGTNGNASEATWKLVSRMTPTGGACTATLLSCTPKEVWRDERTGLIWSTKVGGNTKWCEVSGNAQSDDPVATGSGGCSASTNQPGYPSNPNSFCSETGPAGMTMTPASSLSETWTTGTYNAAKGGMGLNSTPSVQWRLPTIKDYRQADLDGIRHVMPDMGAMGGSPPEWSSTLLSKDRGSAWGFNNTDGAILSTNPRSTNGPGRCVGR